MNRRDFLVRTGLVLSAGMLTAPEEVEKTLQEVRKCQSVSLMPTF